MDDTVVEKRRRDVAELYFARLTHGQIAKQLGYERSTITKDILALRKEWKEERTEKMDAIIQKELDLLDANESLLIIQFRRSQGLNTDLHKEIIRSMVRRARLLGLDAPARTETYTRDETARDTLLEKAQQYTADILLATGEVEELSGETDGE